MPSLDAANIALTLLSAATEALLVGPLLLGVSKPVHVMVPSVTARGIVNMTALAVAQAAGAKTNKRSTAMEVLDLKAMAEQAIALHQQGKLAEAEAPVPADSWRPSPALFGPRYYMGLMRMQQGRNAEACDFLGEALNDLSRRSGLPDELRHGAARRRPRRKRRWTASTGRWRSSPTWPKAFTIAAWRWPTCSASNGGGSL